MVDVVYNQDKKNKKFGMTDKRYENSLNELISTFCVRTFQNIMPLILEVLEKMKKDYGKEKDTICVSFGPVDLFKFMNEIFDTSMACPSPLVQRSILSLIYK